MEPRSAFTGPTLAETVAQVAISLPLDAVRLTDEHGVEGGLVTLDQLTGGRGELLGLLLGSREAWLRFSDGTSVTLRVHGRTPEKP